MSHFTVMVISDKPLDEASLDPILMPWHEYECTGLDNEYVVDVDMTDEVTEEFNKPCDVVVLADGKIIGRYDDSLYTDSTDEHGYKCKNRALPEGAVEKEISAEEARKHGIGYKTMAECAEDYYGANERDGRFYRRTNPNKKWDWWVVGGRWSDSLRLKGNVAEALAHVQALTKRGLPIPDSTKKLIDGVSRGDRPWTTAGEPQEAGYCDIARKRQIDFEGMANDAEKKALEHYHKAIAVIAGRSYETWDEVRERFEKMEDSNALVAEGRIEAARKFFHNQEVIVDLKKENLMSFFGLDEELKKFRTSAEDVALRARRRSFQTYAVVKDGKWYEQGEMGWWGISSNEKDPDDWDKEFAALIEGLPDDTFIAMIDCHI